MKCLSWNCGWRRRKYGHNAKRVPVDLTCRQCELSAIPCGSVLPAVWVKRYSLQWQMLESIIWNSPLAVRIWMSLGMSLRDTPRSSQHLATRPHKTGVLPRHFISLFFSLVIIIIIIIVSRTWLIPVWKVGLLYLGRAVERAINALPCSPASVGSVQCWVTMTKWEHLST